MTTVYIGYDPREELAVRVNIRSLRRHASIPFEVRLLKDWELRRRGIYWRTYFVDRNGQMTDGRDGRPFSTQFSFSRFAVPLLAKQDGIAGPVIYCDADMMWRADIKNLIDLWEPGRALMCVQHNQTVTEETKMDGVIQSLNGHGRKNWSSLMMMDPMLTVRAGKVEGMSPYLLNNQTGESLHALTWLSDDMIGALPEEWNYLVGHSNPEEIKNPSLVHHTLGTPDMVGDCEYADEWWGYADSVRLQPLQDVPL